MICEMAPAEVLGEGGKVVGMTFESRDGYSNLKLKADKVVFAIGQALDGLGGLAETDKGLLDTGCGCGCSCCTKLEGVFAAGDAVNGGKTVVEAVAQGKDAVKCILKYLDEKGGAR